MSVKPLASLSLDLDNRWSYLKTHGDSGWTSFPSYLDRVAPRVLQFLAERSLRITVFVVGQDAALPGNHDALAAIARAGHEIGNHSFSHEPWMHQYSKERIADEICRAAEHIESVTGQRPVGFRGPGFCNSPLMMNVLSENGYLYDASTLPTFLGPLARAYYFKTAKLSPEESEKRGSLFGTFRDGFRPLKPYRQSSSADLIEIPVTTMPGLRTPIHASYILYLSGFSPTVALMYFQSALRLCLLAGVTPSLLLHPPDFMGCEDGIGLEFFPGMQLSRAKKLDLLGRILGLYSERFQVVTLQEHACRAAEQWGIDKRSRTCAAGLEHQIG
jgi:hypothetical protein